jgi:hypothetical protein
MEGGDSGNLRYNPVISMEGVRQITKNLRIAGLRVEIWTWDLPNMK